MYENVAGSETRRAEEEGRHTAQTIFAGWRVYWSFLVYWPCLADKDNV